MVLGSLNKYCMGAWLHLYGVSGISRDKATDLIPIVTEHPSDLVYLFIFDRGSFVARLRLVLRALYLVAAKYSSPELYPLAFRLNVMNVTFSPSSLSKVCSLVYPPSTAMRATRGGREITSCPRSTIFFDYSYLDPRDIKISKQLLLIRNKNVDLSRLLLWCDQRKRRLSGRSTRSRGFG